ncbi:DUF393 domain-containing protein [Alteromonas sp. ASW11-36]|uniref:DUF393 domain-containing protein n=1 Tax=Alteromonas arenosi TaxID=3055817 RepID=A0ABT7SZ62_9ALTE|nr:DUF393 domain-containing protein [Alteromonas sp. ASW11-36]MDM7861450.1 DUF393 domain-containing protein [Alteromonas sp. ASW11-36]
MQFTVFYDGGCPLCMTEMRHLMKRNTENKLAFVDINHPSFAVEYPELDSEACAARIHGRWSNGQMLTGLDVTYTAWRLVGKGWLYAPLRWPLIKPLADRLYIVFAKHRHRISYWLTGKERCDSGSCQINEKN